MSRKRQAKVRICEWCGNQFGKERGPAAKTCSEECQRDRNNAREKARYASVKDTEKWQETRRAYVDSLKQRLAADHEFASAYRAAHRINVARHRAANPETPEQQQAKREERRRWRKWLLAEPMAWEAHKFKCRERYASLTPQQKSRLYQVPFDGSLDEILRFWR